MAGIIKWLKVVALNFYENSLFFLTWGKWSIIWSKINTFKLFFYLIYLLSSSETVPENS